MKNLIIATTPLQAKITQHTRASILIRNLSAFMSVLSKMPVRSIMPRILTMFTILRRRETWLRFVKSWSETMTPSFMLVLTIA